MIAAISLIQRRNDIDPDIFREHWLDPHGVMTAELPGLRHYVQHHCTDLPAANDRARELRIDGFPELWFDDYAARSVAYTSPRIAECNVDSEAFIGAVSRLVTEPRIVLPVTPVAGLASAIVLTVGSADPSWNARTEEAARSQPGLEGYVAHRIIEQASAPNSRIPELAIPVAGFALVTFATEADLIRAAPTLSSAGADDTNALFAVESHTFV